MQEPSPLICSQPPVTQKVFKLTILTTWFMEPGGSMLHSQGSPIISSLSQTNPIPHIDTHFFKILIWSSHLRLGLPKGLFPAGVPFKILKALLPSPILAT